MGIDDRDYMRERYARRRGLSWNDKLGRVEQGDPDTVLPIPANGPARLARRPRPPAQFANDPESPINSTVQSIALLILIAGLALVLIWWAISAWFKNNYRTFPPSGSVTVSSILSPRTATSKLRIKTGRRQAIVQLLTPETGNHVISIFMQPNQSRDVPVPPGTWRLRVIKGEEWSGPRSLFGQTTTISAMDHPTQLSAKSVRTLDLTRDPPPPTEDQGSKQ